MAILLTMVILVIMKMAIVIIMKNGENGEIICQTIMAIMAKII
jgi:hypothetical protein